MLKSSFLGFSLLFLFACGDADNQTNNGETVGGSNNGLNNGSNNGNNGSNNGSTGSNNGTTAAKTSALNYYTDIKPIIDDRCVDCHMSGGIAPFALTTFEEVYSIRALVASSVKSRTMPPFLEDADCREYEFDTTLSLEQMADIEEWATSDAKEGDKNNPGAPLERAPYTPPVLDTVLPMAESYTPKISPDDYRCFVIDWPHETDKFITGFGVTPGTPEMVHHMIAYLAEPDSVDKALALDAAEDGPGYTCFGDSGAGDGTWLGSWAPGGVDTAFPEGTGSKIEAGSKIILQLHYSTLKDAPVADLSSVKFRTADTVEKEGLFIPFTNPRWQSAKTMDIPAGNADVRHSFSIDPFLFINGVSQINVHTAGLHMHLLGKSIKSVIKKGNGNPECLADIPRWDFNWQSGVAFKEPAVLVPGDELSLECHWDNSMENQPVVNGQRRTPTDVNWGEGTTDEMCLGVFFVTFD